MISKKLVSFFKEETETDPCKEQKIIRIYLLSWTIVFLYIR